MRRGLRLDARQPRRLSVCDLSASLVALARLPLGFQLSSDATMLRRRGYGASEMNRGSIVWNAQLSKTLCKGNLTLSLATRDLLGQTAHNSWTVTSEGYTSAWHNGLPRYMMLCIAYKLQNR